MLTADSVKVRFMSFIARNRNRNVTNMQVFTMDTIL